MMSTRWSTGGDYDVDARRYVRKPNVDGNKGSATVSTPSPVQAAPAKDPDDGTPAAIVTLSGSNGDVEEKAIVYERPKKQASGQPAANSFDPSAHSEFYVKDSGKFLSCAWSVATLAAVPEYKGTATALEIANDLLQRTNAVSDAMSACKDGVGVRMTHYKAPPRPAPIPQSVGGGDCPSVGASHLGTVNNAVVNSMGDMGSRNGYVECGDPSIFTGSNGGGGQVKNFVIDEN